LTGGGFSSCRPQADKKSPSDKVTNQLIIFANFICESSELFPLVHKNEVYETSVTYQEYYELTNRATADCEKRDLGIRGQRFYLKA
jgi:hypothetical protein